MEGRRRATSEEQKHYRQQTIVQMAWQMFREMPYQTITMAEIAEKSGLAKGTVYLYFRTKEELFLHIQEEQLRDWFTEINSKLENAAPDIKTVSKLISDSLERRPELVRLLAMLHNILEQNIDYETAVRFKHFLLENMSGTGALLEKVLLNLKKGQGLQILLYAQALVIGLQNLADPSPLVKEVLTRETELQSLQISFSPHFGLALEALLDGFQGN
jgi:AcrR family transcriptional regulator